MHPHSEVARWVSPKQMCVFELIAFRVPFLVRKGYRSTSPLIGKVKNVLFTLTQSSSGLCRV